MFGGDAAAGVADADLHEGVAPLDGYRHLAASGRVAQRVVDEVLQHALDHCDVGMHLCLRVAARRKSESNIALLCGEPVVLHHVLQKLGQAEHLLLRLDPTGVELGKLEQIGDALAQQAEMAQRGAKVLCAGCGVQRVLAHEHGFYVALDAGQRRAQVVRDVADQLAPLPIAVLQALELLRNARLHRAHCAAQHVDLVARLMAHRRAGFVAKGAQLIGEAAQRPRQLLPGDPQHHCRQGRGSRHADRHRLQGSRVGQAGRHALRHAAVENDVEVSGWLVAGRACCTCCIRWACCIRRIQFKRSDREGVGTRRVAWVGADDGQPRRAVGHLCQQLTHRH